MGIIIAAGALFTAVYDVIYKYNSSNTTNLNAATVDMTGQTEFGYYGAGVNSGNNYVVNMDKGVYLVEFWGHNGDSVNGRSSVYTGKGAVCIAFYRSDGVNGNAVYTMYQTGGSGYRRGGASVRVDVNFARAAGYENMSYAIAGGGGGSGENNDYVWSCVPMQNATFAGYEGGSCGGVRSTMGIGFSFNGAPATQNHGGYRYQTGSEPINPNAQYNSACGTGGAGYYFGGAGQYGGSGECYKGGGGGSCSPVCYPLFTSDSRMIDGTANQGSAHGQYSGSAYEKLNKYNWSRDCGAWYNYDKPDGGVRFHRIDPGEAPKQETGDHGVAVLKVPDSAFIDRYLIEEVLPTNTGIRAGWVYSVSEDGKSWQGVGPDGLDFDNLVQNLV